MSTCLERLPQTPQGTTTRERQGQEPSEKPLPSASTQSHASGALQDQIPAPNPTSYLGTTPLYKHQDPSDYYFFERVSGKGGYATVYTCHHLETGVEYACKAIQTEDDEDRVMQALREACMQISVSKHPNVATLKEVWVIGRSQVFLIMENCKGGEVFRAISERGALPEVEAASVLRVVLQIVSYCHDRGLIHHDLKPENFMIKDKEKGLRKDNIRAIDFGSTTFADSPFSHTSGTPHYSAPEVIRGEWHDYRADIWSAGVILYCMLTGLHPFIGDNKMAVKLAVQNQPIDYEEDPWPFVSPDAKDLCQRMLTRDPDKRISVSDALRHPWMQQHKLGALQPHQSSLAARLEAFAGFTPLQRYLMLEYATPFAEDTARHQAAYDLFDWMDEDGDGVLCKSGFLAGMTDLEGNVGSSNHEAIFAALSQNEHETVSWPEFLAAVIERQQDNDEPEVLHSVRSRGEEIHNSRQRKPLTPRHGGQRPSSADPTSLSKHQAGVEPTDGVDMILEAWEKCWPADSIFHSPSGERNDDTSAKTVEKREQPSEAKYIQCSHGWMSYDDESSLHGGSPLSDVSAWDKMRAVRGGSPRSPAGSEAEKRGAKFEEHLGMSGILDSQDSSGHLDSNFSANECFVSGGVTYWYRRDGHNGGEESEEDSDSDNLYGPALADHQARHLDTANI